MYPHERSLVERLQDKPFALIGVNSDIDKKELKKRMEKEKITWRSFWCGPEGTGGPIPTAWKTDAELRGVYYDSLDAASEPFKVRNAKPALKKCLDLSVKYQYFDEYSRNCEVWLAKNYKSEYHVVDELRGAPTLSNSGLDEKAPPVLTDGTFWHPPAAAPEKTTVSTTEEGGGAEPKGGAKPASKAATPAAAKPPGGARPLPGGKKK